MSQKELEKLYRDYNRQIARDYKLRDNVAKRLKAFAPYKKGDKIKYMPKWMFGGGYVVTEFKRFGVVVDCTYNTDKFEGGKWVIRVCPTKKDFTEHGTNKGHEWLGTKHVRKVKQ